MKVSWLLAPAILLTNKLSFTKKFILIGLIYLVAIATLLFAIFSSLNKTIHIAQHELDGVALMKPLLSTVQIIQRHRGLEMAILSINRARRTSHELDGNQALQAAHIASEIDADMAMRQMELALPHKFSSGQDWLRIKNEWDAIELGGNSWQSSTNFEAHNLLIEKILIFAGGIADKQMLTLDAEIDTFYLIETATKILPTVLEEIGRIRGLGIAVLSQRRISKDQKILLHQKISSLRNSIKILNISVEKTALYNPKLKNRLSKAVVKINQSSEQIIALIEQDILSETFAAEPYHFFSVMTKLIEGGYAQIFQTLLPTTEDLLKVRIQQVKKELVWHVSLTMMVLLIAHYFLIGIYLSMHRGIRTIATSAHNFTQGNTDERVRIETDDELRLIGESFNQTAAGFKKLLKQHLESEAHLRIIIESAFDGFIGMDGQGQITEWNKSAESIFGWSREEVLGEIMHDLIIPFGHREQYLTTWRGASFNSRIEILGLHRNGHEFLIELAITPIVIANEVIFSIYIRDITERKKAEEILLAASQAKSDFVANMSHEIRTPMNVIIGMSNLALKTELNSKQHNYLDKIARSANHMLGIINDILDFSKIEANKMTMEHIDFQLNDVMDDLVNLVGTLADKKGVKLLLVTAPEVPISLVGDALRLNQILVNLINNAIKFTDKGNVIINVELVATTNTNDFAELLFSVKDTGIGMTAQQCDKLFQSFGQADTSITRKYGGTGLGLAISKKLVEMMDGNIWVESEVNKGSTFHFRAKFGLQKGNKIEMCSNDKAHDMEEFMERLIGTRVLLVEDNELNQELALELLRSAGMEVVLANNGQESLDILEQDAHFDCILMDCQMPVMDGYTATRSIRQSLVLKDIPIIALSANALISDQKKAIESGMNDHVAKPIIVNKMFATIAKWIKPKAIAELANTTAINDGKSVTGKLNGVRVLLVEDNEMLQELAAEMLNDAGVDVVIANNGQESLDILEHDTHFDCILMDCQMPVMDGLVATSMIRQNPALKDIVIIAMTGNVAFSDEKKVTEAGMNDYIAKPYTADEVVAKLEKWIVPKARAA